MSSFQSFKSFMKIQENNISNLPSKSLGANDNNHKQSESIEAQQPGINIGAQALQKNSKRIKKPGAVCNFIAKLYSMLEEQQIESIISWSFKESSYSSKYLDSNKIHDIHTVRSSSFQIFDVLKFEQVILPKYFKHSNMSSFVRQLNMYGFHKLRGDKNNFEFQHEKFQKNRKDLLPEIRRKGPEFMGVSSSNFDDPIFKGTLENLKSFDDKMHGHSQKFMKTEQQIEFFREEMNESNLFPSEGFIPMKKVSLEQKGEFESENSIGKDKIKKLEMIEEQNSRLKKIKSFKVQRIKDLNSVNKEAIQTKFSKILFTFLTLKMKQELEKSKFCRKPDLDKENQENQSAHTIHRLADHIMNSSQAQSFENYKGIIRDLLKPKSYVVPNLSD